MKSDEESMKETPKEVICLVDSSDMRMERKAFPTASILRKSKSFSFGCKYMMTFMFIYFYL
jgi:hypothetical protein